jgi:arylsulfatase A-like enzyme
MPISKNYLEPSQYTLAEALRDAGYRTGHFGKWHLGLTEPHWPERQGFDVAFHCEPSAGPPGFYFSPYGVVPPGSERPTAKGQKYVVGTITDGPDGEYITDRLTDEALKFIEDSQHEPFFLNLWHFGVHGPWGHKESYTAQFAEKTDPTGRQGNPVMASMLRSIDESLGRVMEKLDQLDLSQNTLLIFYSDNGGNVHSMTEGDTKAGRGDAANPTVASYRKWAGFQPPTNNTPLREGKGRIYEGGQRVPLMVRWPGRVAKGTTSDAVVGPIDLYPTILDAVQVQRPKQQIIDGVSFLPVLEQTGHLQREAYFTWFPHLIPAVSVRQGPWKLIRRFEPHRDYPDVRELYQLNEDVGEATNLAAKMPEKVRELDALIDRFVKETGALYPQPNPDYQPSSASDPLKGLVPKFSRATLIEGAARIEADGRTPFLGTAQVKLSGPLTLALRIRSEQGGSGKVQWKTAGQAEFPKEGQTVPFVVPAGSQWQDVTVTVPVEGQSGIIRIYLPADRAPVEIESIQFTAKNGKLRAWSFAKAE